MTQERTFGPVRFIPGANQGKYPFCNSVYVEGAQVLIDPASDRDRLTALREDPGVKTVWLSHWHEDHFMHLDLFDDLPLWAPEKDLPPLQDLEVFMDWYGFVSPEEKIFWRAALKDQFHYRPRQPARTFAAAETIALGSVTVQVIPAPGHTPGSVCFFFQEPGVLFLADYDLTRFGPWYGDRGSSIEQTIASVKALREIPARVCLAGHEAGVYEPPRPELWDRYLAVIDERENKLRDFLAEPRTMDQITGAWIVYGRPREPKGFFEFGERAIMGKHLDRLLDRGEAVQQDGKYRLKSGRGGD